VRGLILASALAAAGGSAVAQTPTFTARVDGVRVDVLATSRGRPAAGLTASDFEVRDNGVLQQVDLVSYGQVPVNVVLALDLSESMAGNRLAHLRQAALALLDGLRPEDQAALITFNHAVTLAAPMGRDHSTARARLTAAEPAGTTAVVDAAFAALIAAEQDVGRSLVMLLGDGADTASWLTPEQVVDIGRRADAVVYAVTAGDAGRLRFLSELSTVTGGRLIEVEEASNLPRTFAAILDEFRTRYLVTYTPRGVEPGGWHRLEVRVRRSGVAVRARPGYLAR
jgi:VWFA-related protein